ncbi:MAG: type IV pilus twitching motility protein PilT [Candidatus Omnitrophica bacterium]|nr:type IV pilus twitching motility protein PilT [Candidatus Omnitrophota bacterium]
MSNKDNGLIQDLLKLMVAKRASDLHLTVGSPPVLRIDEDLLPTEQPPLRAEAARELIYSLLNPEQIAAFEKEKELDMSFGVEGVARFRVNVFLQRGSIGAAIRALPFELRTFEDCGLPVKLMEELCRKQKGLILITGATGSGKSTTLASMVQWINLNRKCHVVTIEDPIEYVYQNQQAIVDQREIGADSLTFKAALKHILRQDPNVILIGEMRDLETIEAALNIAETGHLVLATLHTSDAVQTVNRVVDVFPSHQQQQVRIQLSFVLLAVLSQQLIPKAANTGRILALELLVATPAVRALVREGKGHQLYSVIQTSQRDGMRTMNQSLAELYLNKQIAYEEALARTTDTEELLRLIQR